MWTDFPIKKPTEGKDSVHSNRINRINRIH